MSSYYEVSIIETGRSMGRETSVNKYHFFGEETEILDTLVEVKEYLKQRYGTCKRRPMYLEKTNGGTERVGYVYCFKNDDISHYPVEKWYQRDWATISLVQAEAVLL
jgi:hypothetical protein